MLIWGASGGLGSLRDPVRAERRGDPGLRGVLARTRPSCAGAMGAELIIDRAAEGYRFWKDEHDPGPERVAAVRRPDPRADRRRGPRHRLRAPGPGDLRRLGVRRQARRHHRHLRLDLGLPARVRQPLPVDEPQADHRLALRQLPRGLGGQPADRQGRRSTRRCPGPTRWPRPARPPTTCTATCTRARSACCAWPRAEGLGVRDPRAAGPARVRSTGSASADRSVASRALAITNFIAAFRIGCHTLISGPWHSADSAGETHLPRCRRIVNCKDKEADERTEPAAHRR